MISSGPVGSHDGADNIVGDILIVCQQLLGILGQAETAGSQRGGLL